MSSSASLQGSYVWTDTLKGVYHGPGSVATALPKLLHILNAKKALIVTGKSLYSKVVVHSDMFTSSSFVITTDRLIS